MIRLRPITALEFPVYRAYFVEDYSRELVDNYGHRPETARRLAENDINESFPEGVPGPGQHLLGIEEAESSRLTGYLWHAWTPGTDHTFIMDFFMAPEHRGRGYGKAALAALEGIARQAGLSQIKLRVAFRNPRALALYQELGYQITGYNMAKNLKADDLVGPDQEGTA